MTHRRVQTMNEWWPDLECGGERYVVTLWRLVRDPYGYGWARIDAMPQKSLRRVGEYVPDHRSVRFRR